MADPAVESEAKKDTKPVPAKVAASRRAIPGNFSYTPSHGRLRDALNGIIRAERPDKVSGDFVETVLGISGGSGRAIPPILKRIGFVSSDGTPTDLYAKFQSESARSQAALEGLRAGFGELFKRNTYAHKLSEPEVRDLLVEITGLKKDNQTLGAILGTFEAIRGFVKEDAKIAPQREEQNDLGKSDPASREGLANAAFGLSYQINIVLPETSDISVFNAIFRSLRENLLRD